MAKYYRPKRNYRKKPKKRVVRRNASRISRNTKKINSLVKSTLVKTYWKHNDDARVDTLFPSVDEPHYRSFTPLVPTQLELLFNKMSEYTEQQKVRINSCKVNLTLTLANSQQAFQPIDYSIFCVKIKPRMRAQFYQHNSGASPGNQHLHLIKDIHYTGNVPAGMARLAPGVEANLANIRLNPDIFDIHYYKHGYFSTNIKNQTAVGSLDNINTTALQLRRCSFYIPYKCELKCDSWDETTGTSNRNWTDMSQDEIPLFNRYHILIFTSANYQLIPNMGSNPANNLLQANIQCLFNATSAN